MIVVYAVSAIVIVAVVITVVKLSKPKTINPVTGKGPSSGDNLGDKKKNYEK